MKVPETIMDSLHGTDFVVDAFEFAVGDRVFGGVKDGRAKSQQRLGEGCQQGDASLHGSFDPVVKKQCLSESLCLGQKLKGQENDQNNGNKKEKCGRDDRHDAGGVWDEPRGGLGR
ncbi:MAG: hypothetical protein WCG66_04635 [bacterium]